MSLTKLQYGLKLSNTSLTTNERNNRCENKTSPRSSGKLTMVTKFKANSTTTSSTQLSSSTHLRPVMANSCPSRMIVAHRPLHRRYEPTMAFIVPLSVGPWKTFEIALQSGTCTASHISHKSTVCWLDWSLVSAIKSSLHTGGKYPMICKEGVFSVFVTYHAAVSGLLLTSELLPLSIMTVSADTPKYSDLQHPGSPLECTLCNLHCDWQKLHEEVLFFSRHTYHVWVSKVIWRIHFRQRPV